jgi:hypothetical protein
MPAQPGILRLGLMTIFEFKIIYAADFSGVSGKRAFAAV